MLQKIKIPISLGYVICLAVIPWNFITFYLACLGAWLIVLLWLPFNPKPYKTSISFKLLLFLAQALLMLLFTWAIWRLFPLERMLNPQIPPKSAQQEEAARPNPLASQQTNLQPQPAPAEPDLETPSRQLSQQELEQDTNPIDRQFSQFPLPPEEETLQAATPAKGSPQPSGHLLPQAKQPGNIRKLTAKESAEFQKEIAQEGEKVPAEKDRPNQDTRPDPLTLHPEYDRALNEVNKEIFQQDTQAIYPLLSPNQRKLVQQPQPPFIRLNTMTMLLQMQVKQAQKQIQHAKENNLSDKKVAALKETLAKLQTVLQEVKTHRSPDYKRRKIEEKLNQYMQEDLNDD